MATFVESLAQEIIPPKTYPAIPDARPTTLIVACIDPRFLLAVWLFIHEGLGLAPGQFILLLNLGGPLHLCERKEAPLEFICHHDTVSFCFKGGKFPFLRELVAINHAGCAAYAEMQKRRNGSLPEGMSMEQFQLEGLSQRLPEHIATAIPEGTRLRTFYMRTADRAGDTVSFHEV